MEVIKKDVQLFQSRSGLATSLEKREIFFGNVPENTKAIILNCLPFKSGIFPIPYLGVPLSPKQLKVVDFAPLISKLKSRIHNWKNKFLSFGGRRQLIISVLQSLQLYWMSIFLFPSGVVHEIESLVHNFLWNLGESSKGKCRIAWADVCKPLVKGGLGIKRITLWNRALLSRHIWDILPYKRSF